MGDGATTEVSISKPLSRNGVEKFAKDQSIFAEEEGLIPVVLSLKGVALGFLQRMGAEPWLVRAVRNASHLDSIVSDMIHVIGGQRFILQELQKLKPDITWNRAGTLQRWSNSAGKGNLKLYTKEQLDTIIIDRGENGLLGRPLKASSFLGKVYRPHPVMYTLTLDDLIYGLDRQAIGIVSEHEYDLRVKKGVRPWPEYLAFCRDRLKTEEVAIPFPISAGGGQFSTSILNENNLTT